MKASNLKVTKEFLNSRIHKVYGKAKWLQFCEELLDEYELYLYEARHTFSKYITIKKNDKSYKVRFSNHKPNWRREFNKDCDFFVGVSNYNITTTEDALKAVNKYFSKTMD